MWTKIKNHPNYEAHPEGFIRSLDSYANGPYGSKTFRKGKVLKPWNTTSGYSVVQLTGGRRYAVHRLIAETFIPNPENKPYVNHIDGNKQNNRVDNLEWVTPAENNYHAKEIGLRNDRIRVRQIDMLTGKVIAEYKSLKEASKVTGLDYSSIAYAARGVYKHSGGFKWERVTTSRKA